MPHALSMPSSGLQALILCGPGSSFPTFTSNPDENPKALLPIANRPMVWYPIDFCHRMGITNITLICPPSASQAITSALNTHPVLTSLPLPRPDVLAPKDLDLNTGTAEILRLPEVRAIVETDFVVLPCDLVCDLSGEKVLQTWMVKAASLVNMLGGKGFSNGRHASRSGALSVWYNTKSEPVIKKEETDFIATAPLPSSPIASPKGSLFPHVSSLVYSMPTETLKDHIEEKEALMIRHGLLRANPRVRMLTTHRDAHIYIFPHWVLDFINENERLQSIGEDVAGWWAKASWQPALAEKLHFNELCGREVGDKDRDAEGEGSVSPSESSPKGNTGATIPDSTAGEETRRGEPADSKADNGTPPLLAYVHPSQQPSNIIRRVDTAQLLLAISLQLAKLPSAEESGPETPSPFAHAKKVAYPEGVKPRTTITKQDCLIADNVTVEEKTSIKECVVGANSQIREGAKLSQCLIMEGAVVGKGCKLTKCILGKRCVIGDGSTLTDCEVQENLLVEARTEEKDRKFMSSEGLEATEAEMEEVLQEMDQEVAEINEVNS